MSLFVNGLAYKKDILLIAVSHLKINFVENLLTLFSKLQRFVVME
jgi:hypothetical protein